MGRARQRVKFRSTPFHGARRAFAVHSRPWGSSGEGSAAQAVAMPRRIFPGTPLGRRRFLGALSLASGAMAWRRALFQCAAGRAAAYRPYGRVRALPQLFSFWADAQQGKGRGFLERKPPKELLRSLRSASLQLQLLPGVFPRFRQGAQGGQVLLIPVGVLQHALFVEAGAHQPLALL